MKVTLAILAIVALAVCARLVQRRPAPAPPDDYAEPVPMAAWDGTATYNPNAHTIRVRWAPTTTEV